ncbi:D(5)-like dopamine receptor [Solea senegalensis]|uniref:D(5)-like dopamine receptor n=1 Tax=Solea senegalensis TaxID=28829 RepID=A0AAV6RSG2_SOLSE|nr:D(5)-like dopamine receptor [Solea senegalensis]
MEDPQQQVVTAGGGPGPAPGPAPGPGGVSLRALTGCVLCALIVSTLLGNTLIRRISSLERAAGPRAPNHRLHRASTHDESSLKTTFKRETKYCSTSTVEAVDFSNELVSYHHDTTLQKEACVSAPGPGAPRISACMPPPHAAALHNFDAVSALSDESQKLQSSLLPSVLQYQCEAEISLDMIPFNSSGPTDCYVIPGQIPDL